MRKIVLLVTAPLLYVAISVNAVQAAQWLGPQQGKERIFRQADLESLLADNPLGANENIRAVPLYRSERSSNVLVQIRDREPLHLHADSDITVFMLRGKGELRIGKQMQPVNAGDVLHIPRGAVHAYINRGPEPAAALVVYSPAPGPKDRILVEDKP